MQFQLLDLGPDNFFPEYTRKFGSGSSNQNKYGITDPDPQACLKLAFSWSNFEAVLGIQICRIRSFLSLPNPDPLVRGTDPAPDPSFFP